MSKTLNRVLGADFDVEQFAHVARFNEEEEWIEMRLRARSDQKVRVAGLDLIIGFEEGEDLLTEISAKFHLEGVRAELIAAGLQPVASWTDRAGDFALTLARR